MSFVFPALNLDVNLLWQNVVNVLASIGPLLALFVGMGLFFVFAEWLRDFLAGLRAKKEDKFI